MDAERLFAAFAREPLYSGEHGAKTEHTFQMFFVLYNKTYLAELAANLEYVRSEDLFVLKFDHYLAHLPVDLVDMGIEPLRVEIVRMNSAPTEARAGYYEVPSEHLVATVERVFPTQHDCRHAAPLYAQHIRVSGPSLKAAQDFNSRISEGLGGESLVNAFE